MNELMLQKNDEVIEAIVKWRSVTVDSLKTFLKRDERESAFRQRLIRLEAGKVLCSKKQEGINKIVYLSKELIFRFGIEGFNEENIRHDAVVSNVGISLMNFERIKSVKLPHEFRTKSSWKHHVIEPDAILEVDKNDKILRVALEVELWRKDRKRVFDKLLDYSKAYEYDNVFYFFADRGSFESYKKRHCEILQDQTNSHLREELEKKLIFIFNPSIAKKVRDLEKSEVFHDLKVKTLGSLVG